MLSGSPIYNAYYGRVLNVAWVRVLSVPSTLKVHGTASA